MMTTSQQMKFQIHTSDELLALFRKRPFQGQDPKEASIIFLNSDANYSPKISGHSFFNRIIEYLKDGVAFWHKYGYHHPFVSPDYPFDKRKDGVPFHRNFSKLKLEPEKHAEHISFLELLNVPTIGEKSEDRQEFFNFLCLNHLQYIEKLIDGGGRKLFFVSRGILKDIIRIKKAYPVFNLINITSRSNGRFMQMVNENIIKEIYHFSSPQIHSQLKEKEIESDINKWLGKNR